MDGLTDGALDDGVLIIVAGDDSFCLVFQFETSCISIESLTNPLPQNSKRHVNVELDFNLLVVCRVDNGVLLWEDTSGFEVLVQVVVALDFVDEGEEKHQEILDNQVVLLFDSTANMLYGLIYQPHPNLLL